MVRKRTLRPEEEELWQVVAKTTTPMHADRVAPATGGIQNLPTALAPQPAPAKHQPLPRFRLGESRQNSTYHRPHDVLPSLSEQLATAPISMDRKNFDRMARGKLSPEARIDLHGMTVAEAHPELIRFILNAHSQGLRLVLVITGKGKQRPDHGPIPQRHGILKHQVPHWLRLPPLNGAILQVAEAHLRHGGSGAYYVYLRRQR